MDNKQWGKKQGKLIESADERRGKMVNFKES